jgi:hypothetical protein
MSPLNGSTVGEMISELAYHGLHQLITIQNSVVLGVLIATGEPRNAAAIATAAGAYDFADRWPAPSVQRL